MNLSLLTATAAVGLCLTTTAVLAIAISWSILKNQLTLLTNQLLQADIQ